MSFVNTKMLLLIVIFLILVSCPVNHTNPPATPADTSRKSLATKECLSNKCSIQFPYQNGWLGGDVGYSVSLSEDKTLWVFGDTFIGSPEQTDNRIGAKMIANSIGISSCTNCSKNYSMEYIWRDHNGQYAPFFGEKEEGNIRYWPMDTFKVNDDVYVGLVKVKKISGGGNFAFRFVGNELAKLSHVSRPVQNWDITYHPFTLEHMYLGVSFVVHGKYLYVFAIKNTIPESSSNDDDAVDDEIGFSEGDKHQDPSMRHIFPLIDLDQLPTLEMYCSDSHPVYLIRVKITNLDNPLQHVEYYSKNNKFEKGWNLSNALALMGDGRTEMTVRYHAGSKKWLAVTYGYGECFPSDKISIATAEKITGPWSKFKIVATVPEMTPGSPSYDKHTFCYGAKEHVWKDTDSSVFISYNCNSSIWEKQIKNMAIYRPQPIEIKIEDIQ